MHPGNAKRSNRGQGNANFGRGFRSPTPSTSNAGHLISGVIRRPIGPSSQKPFLHRGGHQGFAKASTVVDDPFASDDDSPSSRSAPHQHYAGGYQQKQQRTKSQNFREQPNRGGRNASLNREYPRRDNRNVEHLREHRRGWTDNRNTEDGEINEGRRRRQTYALGFKKLEEFLIGSPEDVLLKLLENIEAFSLLLEKNDVSPDCICLILQAIIKLADSSFDTHILKILHIVTKEDFIKQLIVFVVQLPLQDDRDKRRAHYFWKDPTKFFVDLNRFCEVVLKVIPTTAFNILPKLLKAALCSFPHLALNNDICTLYQNLEAKLLTAIESFEKKKSAGMPTNPEEDELQPPDNFRDINIFPEPIEIVTLQSPFLRSNIVEGAYKNIEHYLDVQFRLVRNDFVKPLRDGICSYLDKDRKRKIQNIKIYNGVVFLKAEMCSNATNGYLIQLPQKNKKGFQLKLENPRLFMFGSLVCFTKDNFKNITFGRIVDRKLELLKEGRLVVALHSTAEKIDFAENYIMIESKVYFEPYHHVLSALKQIDEDDFPMREYIVDMQPVTDLPNYYLENDATIEGNRRIPIMEGEIYEDFWPTAEQLRLNDTQYAAYKNALSSKFSIIQGPPGTGKTYLGLEVAKTLLFNADIWHKETCPMLVICFTNHALDQFLEGLLRTTKDIARIGGQSKNKTLDHYNIRHLRNNSHNRLIQVHHLEVKLAAETLKRLYDLLEATRRFAGVVNIKPLLTKLPEVQGTWFSHMRNEEFTKWLFEGTIHKNVTTLDITKFFQQQTPKEAINKEDEQAVFREIFELFDTEAEHNIDNDILDLNYSGASAYMITINNYRENLRSLEQQATCLNNLQQDADPREWDKLLNTYQETSFEHEYLEAVLVKGKQLTDAQPPEDMLLHLQDPDNMPPEDRWKLYFYWVKCYETQILKSIDEAEAEYRKVYREYEDVKYLADIELLRTKKVIGMTTTSAARLQLVLRALRSRLVIVEEAAEIMEAHVITALTRHCEQLILIGDHQQLRPSTADYEMETKYNLGISLFERMVRNKMHCNVLQIQHRMRPEFAKLIVPTIYPVLHDHESVHHFPPIRGVDRNLFFIHHKISESVEKDESKFNMHEVTYLINLAQYLILNGYDPEDITILCAYSAQLFKMFHERRKHTRLQNVRICVLDNYQGEESKIILLSLVRNNNEGKIGFLKIDNRICVALSRAREGFYIMGNMDMLTKVSPIWEKIRKTLESQQNIGEALPLRCEVHRSKVTFIRTSEDFKSVAEGGCDQMCNELLLCGHTCKSQCHVTNRDHSKSSCRENCLKILCEDEHGCPKMCFEECGPCMFPMKRALECGHTRTYPCFDKTPDCQEDVSVKLPCGHQTRKKCYLSLDLVVCPHPCDTRIESCGHACVKKCHIKIDPDHLQYECRKKCDRIRPNCMLNVDEHRCTKACYEECDKCDIIVKKLRSCNHMYQLKCCESIELMHCHKPCKEMLACGHKCKQECSDPCGNCEVIVHKKVPGCGHTIQIACKDTPSRHQCTGPCVSPLPCGHPCGKKCKDPCTTKCKALVRSIVPLSCGHFADIPCFSNNQGEIKKNATLLQHCKEPCTKTLKCEHKCSGSCGECYQGRIHKVCTLNCGVSLVCGHVCKTPCRQVCPPCIQVCEFRCPHSKCKKRCGEPCTPCKERCTRRCEHQYCQKRCSEICSIPPCKEPCPQKLLCGHDCIGFCGDPCPRLCKVCNYDELIEEFYMGYEEEDDSIFVLLEDCNHIIESRGMDMWLATNNDEINIKCCPKCKQPLVNTRRYSDYVKKSLKNIVAVKNKYYGSFEKNVTDARRNITKLNGLYANTSLKHVCPAVTTLYSMFLNQLKPSFKGKRQMLSKLTVEITAAKIQVLENICNLYDDIFKAADKLPTECMQYLEFLLERLTTDKERMTEQEVEDYEVELKRLRRIFQFGCIAARLPTHKTIEKSYLDLRDQIYSLGPYNIKEDDNIRVTLKSLSGFAGILAVSETEMKQIVYVIGVRSGAWYTCPNGHPYAISDCGGAMEESACADCGAKIGGRGHQLRSDNAHSAVDGSRHAAWSEQANLGNYQLNI